MEAGNKLAVTTYDYDAFGKLINSAGSTPNAYLYAGEQSDQNEEIYYLRARYYKPMSGRFISLDPHYGRIFDPVTLHRYLYANSDPVNKIDPSGRVTLVEVTVSIAINDAIRAIHARNLLKNFFFPAVKIALCSLKPAFRLQDVGIRMAANGLPGGDTLFIEARKMIAEGFREIGKAGVGVYSRVVPQ